MSAVTDTIAALLSARSGGAAAAATALTDAETAYAVQDGVARALGWFDAGAPRFWKSGGAARDSLQTHAALPPAGVWPSPANGARWPFRLRGVEAEIALRLGQPVDAELAASVDATGASALVDAMCVAIEIVDSRWAEALDAPPWAKLADLQSHGALVLGEWRPFAAHDWAAQRCTVQIGDRPPQAHVGSHSMADPAWVLPAWLRHATRGGAVLAAGTVVTTGTWCGLPLAAAGDHVSARFDGIGQASVQL